MKANGAAVQFAGGTLRGQRHICAFFNSIDEEHRVLRSFITEGFARGEKGFHVVDPQLREEHLERLADTGIDVHGVLESGQLEVWTWQDAYLHPARISGNRFNQDAMLAVIEEVLQSGRSAGYPLTRLLAHAVPSERAAEWSLLDKAYLEDLVEYETRLNYMLPKYDDVVICAYDASKFGAAVAMDVLRTHPIVIMGGVLQENPFFIPPDELLAEMRERRSLPDKAARAD